MEGSSADLIEYSGNCHCGKFKFTVKLPEIKSALACDCSICTQVRAINKIDIDSLELSPYKGSEVEPAYVTLSVPGYNAVTVDGEQQQYAGSCHCGAVKYTLMNKPITEDKVISCNCSMCSRNGDMWIYPNKSAVTLHGADSLTGYAFLSKDSLRSFCKTCGVSMLVNNTGPDDKDMPINIRTIHGLDLAGLKLLKYDGKSKDPQYKV
ncbi:hypothetical protein B7463_g4914, partial [Scytalidium lignicola]